MNRIRKTSDLSNFVGIVRGLAGVTDCRMKIRLFCLLITTAYIRNFYRLALLGRAMLPPLSRWNCRQQLQEKSFVYFNFFSNRVVGNNPGFITGQHTAEHNCDARQLPKNIFIIFYSPSAMIEFFRSWQGMLLLSLASGHARTTSRRPASSAWSDTYLDGIPFH